MAVEFFGEGYISKDAKQVTSGRTQTVNPCSEQFLIFRAHGAREVQKHTQNANGGCTSRATAYP